MIKEVKIDKMDELIEALGGGGGIVPTPTTQDEGKVLTANDNGTASWENASGGVPDYSQAAQGSVLATQYSGELGWDRPENLLPEGSLIPSITEDDNGKVLGAHYDDKSGGYAGWVTPEDGLPNLTSQNGGNVLMADTDTTTTPWTTKPAWGKPNMSYSFKKVLASQFTELVDNPGTYRYTGFYGANNKIIIPVADYITGIGIDGSNTGYIETDSTGYTQLTQDGAMKVIVITLNFTKTVVM